MQIISSTAACITTSVEDFLGIETSLGKTYTVAFIIKKLLEKNKDLKILFLAHQVEIVTQSATSFKNM